MIQLSLAVFIVRLAVGTIKVVILHKRIQRLLISPFLTHKYNRGKMMQLLAEPRAEI